MSFKKEKEKSAIEKRFVTAAEVEEIKKKREEEWELARQEGRKIGTYIQSLARSFISICRLTFFATERS